MPSKRIWALAAAVTGIAGAVAATSGAAGHSDNANQPLQMHWSRTGDLVSIKIIGHSDEPVDIQYTLKVKGDSQSVNSGRARLNGQHEQILATINMTARQGWTAELSVGGEHPYSQVAPN